MGSEALASLFARVMTSVAGYSPTIDLDTKRLLILLGGRSQETLDYNKRDWRLQCVLIGPSRCSCFGMKTDDGSDVAV